MESTPQNKISRAPFTNDEDYKKGKEELGRAKILIKQLDASRKSSYRDAKAPEDAGSYEEQLNDAAVLEAYVNRYEMENGLRDNPAGKKETE